MGDVRSIMSGFLSGLLYCKSGPPGSPSVVSCRHTDRMQRNGSTSFVETRSNTMTTHTVAQTLTNVRQMIGRYSLWLGLSFALVVAALAAYHYTTVPAVSVSE